MRRRSYGWEKSNPEREEKAQEGEDGEGVTRTISRYVGACGETMNAIVAVEAFIAFVLAITIHEAAHAAMASTLGDSTAASRGRLSLWPPRQMATIGTMVAIILIFSGIPAGLGWGKPVEIDERRMRVGPDLGMALVAISGPLANLALGVVLAIALRFVPNYTALSTAALRCGGEGGFLQQCLSHAQPIYLLSLIHI